MDMEMNNSYGFKTKEIVCLICTLNLDALIWFVENMVLTRRLPAFWNTLKRYNFDDSGP